MIDLSPSLMKWFSSREVQTMFKDMVRDQGISVIAATHDSTLLAMADQVKQLNDGRMEEHATYGRRFRD